ncbi:hypothetical protein MKZ38_005065 [Zalerion maritima]|uniref:Uncharacterized protein n=1 Tax=Zalerion maritima TaxID=339359 RepID=A0AAD5RKH7_9PEZI|nr:hypothetical protein MKZ38_005065 [Zalerion maritima]
MSAATPGPASVRPRLALRDILPAEDILYPTGPFLSTPANEEAVYWALMKQLARMISSGNESTSGSSGGNGGGIPKRRGGTSGIEGKSTSKLGQSSVDEQVNAGLGDLPLPQVLIDNLLSEIFAVFLSPQTRTQFFVPFDITIPNYLHPNSPPLIIKSDREITNRAFWTDVVQPQVPWAAKHVPGEAFHQLATELLAARARYLYDYGIDRTGNSEMVTSIDLIFMREEFKQRIPPNTEAFSSWRDIRGKLG